MIEVKSITTNNTGPPVEATAMIGTSDDRQAVRAASARQTASYEVVADASQAGLRCYR